VSASAKAWGSPTSRHCVAVRQIGGQQPAEVAHPFFWAPLAVIGNGGEGLVTAQAGAPARRS
jgi:hypothetical protein